MFARVRRYFDVRSGEGRRVLFSFLHVAVVAASFLLARPIRNGLFLQHYGAYALVYVYAAVPVVLSLFVPIYARVSARFGSRRVTVATLIFFSSNVVLFWYAFRFHADAIAVKGSVAWYLPAAFYVWVLRTGNLLRRDCPGAGVDVRQPDVRHAAGAAIVRSDRCRCLARIDWRRTARGSARRGYRRHRQHDARPRRAHPRGGGHRLDRDGADPRRRTSPARESPETFRAQQPAANCRNAVPAADGGAGVSGGDHDPVDGVSAERGGRPEIRRRCRRLNEILWNLQLLARRGELRAAAAPGRARAAPI